MDQTPWSPNGTCARPEGTPTASHSLALRLEIEHCPWMIGRVTSLVGDEGGVISAIDLVRVDDRRSRLDLTVHAVSELHGQTIVRRIEQLEGVGHIGVSDCTFRLHVGGKIEVCPKIALNSCEVLSQAYTPGVARICLAIADDQSNVYPLTIKAHTVAIVTDGTAVLGLGDIGPEAALPVMEGKAMLFKEFGGIDAFPLCLATKEVDRIVDTVLALEPVFGGVNLEDISAPRCFAIEERLKARLAIPVFHDDQHGTAIVVLAALLNALKVVGKRLDDVRVIVHGVGAAGTACARILAAAGAGQIIGFDRSGPLYLGRIRGMNPYKEQLARITNPDRFAGTLEEAMNGADVYIGLSGPGALSFLAVQRIKPDGILFALANPTPEIMPEIAVPHVGVMATGRSDYPNQINNVLAFPGVFRGALESRASEINEPMKLAAAQAIAALVREDELRPKYIVPSVFHPGVAEAVAQAVVQAAAATGVARAAADRQDRDASLVVDAQVVPTAV